MSVQWWNILALGSYILGPLLLCGLLALLFTSRERRRKRSGTLPSLRAFTLLLALAMGLYWLLSMAALTLAEAEQLLIRLSERSLHFADQAESVTGLSTCYGEANGHLGQQYEDPEGFRRSLLEGACLALDFDLNTVSPASGFLSLPGKDERVFEAAVCFLDGRGQPLFEGDILYFPYVTEEQWAGGVSSATLAERDFSYGRITLPQAGTEDPYQSLRELRRRSGSLRSAVQALRLTALRGEDGELFPLSMAYAARSAVDEASMRRYLDNGPYQDSFILDELDREGYLTWEPLFGEGDAGKEAVTLYALDPELYADDTSPLTLRYPHQTLRFESLAAMLRERAASTLPGDLRSLGTVLTIQCRQYRDPRDPSGKTVDLIMLTAVAAHPLKSAVLELWPVYLAAAILALGLTLTLRSLFRKRLLEPMREALGGMAGGWYHLLPDDGRPLWREAEELLAAYRAEEDRRRKEANEHQRLQRALDYAYAAERERRQFTSSLAHELKTPLAVIHSYAEGLKAHIAEEKREKYLDTLLGETERMDALVMQLLDLSRLEAGRVKLSRDEFDLRAMAEGCLEKLSPLAEERSLAVTLLPGEACPLTADEGRMAQAAENLLSNALRYAPEGSRVKVGVEQSRTRARFWVENLLEKPFSPEELEKLWEPFWRRDKARSGPGTGLGLSIVKQIAELHGGGCDARNTDGGVVFSLELPR